MIDVVCGVIRDSAGLYLACRRPAGKHLGGMWEFPGGKVEPGEAAAEALVRELREELGVEVVVGKSLSPVEWEYPTVTIRLLPFFCRVVSGKPQTIEHDELIWCGSDKFFTMAWAPADLPILKEIVESQQSRTGQNANGPETAH